jgi:mannosyl-oligosaccharide alpha-1,2-mannosidase
MKKHMIRQTEKANLLFLHPFDTKSNIPSSTMDHLTCFVPGMLAIGSKIFANEEDLVVAEGLLETCVHMYRTSKTGLSPETWTFHDSRAWNPETYNRTLGWNQEKDESLSREKLDEAINGLGATLNKHINSLLEQVVNSLNQQKSSSQRLTSIYVSDGSYLLRPGKAPTCLSDENLNQATKLLAIFLSPLVSCRNGRKPFCPIPYNW